MATFGPYESPGEYLRDELGRTWPRVEGVVRCRLVEGALPRGAPMGEAEGMAEALGAAFRAALAEYRGEPVGGAEGAGEMTGVEEAYLGHAALVEARIQATREAGLALPFIDLCDRFGLGGLERAALAFALMPELDPGLVVAYRHLAGDASLRGLDARLLALLVYDTPEERALMARHLGPGGPLVRYRLLEIDEMVGPHGRDSMLYRRLRPAARVVELLRGGPLELDAELGEVAELRGAPQRALFPRALVERVARVLGAPGVLVAVQGMRGVGRKLLLEVAAAERGLRLLLVNARALAALPPAQLRPLVRSLVREARLLDAVPVLPDLEDATGPGEREGVPPFVRLLAAEHAGPLGVTVGRERMPLIDFRPLVQVVLEVPSLGDRTALWRMEVPELDAAAAETLAGRFAAPGGVIALAARAALAERLPGEGPPDLGTLDLALRTQLHDRIARLGRRLETPYRSADLVVDEDTRAALDEIVGCMRERRKVRERWGFRGAPGVSVLFSGDPGVGKTMSAQVIARELGLQVYEIDLSRVVSKWLGETEKNLGEVFDAAEPGHVVLLFNEADSLFGKRTSEVKSSNDRYANMETNYLLQRLERFGGLAVLTTNLGKALDPAFRRRFAYDVQFSFPSPEMREALWRKAIPAAAEVGLLDYGALARRFELSGGFIQVAAERAAFSAASRGGPLDMDTLIVTIERMYRERGKLTAVGKLE